jgi:hypothetical protein
MTAPSLSSPPTGGRSSSRFSLRSSSKSGTKRRSLKEVRFWFSSSSKKAPNNSEEEGLAADAAAAAREVDAEFEQTKGRTESSSSYVPRVEYGSPRCDAEERDASWTSSEQVDAHYAALGWTVVSIGKDGNCRFRAISDQLYTNELFHQDIRRRIVDYVEREEKFFQPFVEDEEVADYCARMREDGEWGGHLELYAAAKLFNIHIIVHTGPVRRLRVTNDDEGGAAKQNPPPPPPYRVLHLLYKNDHYSSLHSNEEVRTVAPEQEYTIIPAENADKRDRSPTKTHQSPDKKCVKVQTPPSSKVVAPKGEYTVIPAESTDQRDRSPTKTHKSPDKKGVKVKTPSPSKVVSIHSLAKKSVKFHNPNRKTVKFQDVVEAKPAPREGKAFLCQAEDVPECGVFLPKQVLFRRGKRRVSGATLFSLVHVPSSSNLSPVKETTSLSESSCTTASSTSSETSEEQQHEFEATPPVSGRPKAKAPTLRAVPVEFPSKATFHHGRAEAAVC